MERVDVVWLPSCWFDVFFTEVDLGYHEQYELSG
jgi:hypothetical protein